MPDHRFKYNNTSLYLAKNVSEIFYSHYFVVSTPMFFARILMSNDSVEGGSISNGSLQEDIEASRKGAEAVRGGKLWRRFELAQSDFHEIGYRFASQQHQDGWSESDMDADRHFSYFRNPHKTQEHKIIKMLTPNPPHGLWVRNCGSTTRMIESTRRD